LGFAGAGEPIQRFNRIETYAQRNPAIIGETQPTDLILKFILLLSVDKVSNPYSRVTIPMRL
jgi:hypothetical protein